MPSFITRDELRSAIDGDAVVVIDARPPAPYGERHLPGAVNLADEDVEARIDEVLPDNAVTIVTYSTDIDCARGPALAERLTALGYSDVRTYREGIENWIGAGFSVERPGAVKFDLAELATSPTAALFEGHRRAGVDISIFVVRTPLARAVDLHVHPYAETFLLLEGRGRWTLDDEVAELGPEQMLVVPPDTPHGFRNIGQVPLLVVSVHASGTLRQTWTGGEPA